MYAIIFIALYIKQEFLIMATPKLTPNKSKKTNITVDGQSWSRLPIKTYIITDKDIILEVIEKYTSPHLQNGDLIFISESVVAITQGRAVALKDIQPSFFAKKLSKAVYKNPHGIGLSIPESMELAIREAGLPRILMAATISVITKPFGFRGIFYKIAGNNINAIDVRASHTLPRYRDYVILAPANPNRIAKDIAKALGHKIVIIDANDLGVAVLGKSSTDIEDEFCKQVFRDNPLGQAQEQTPLAIVRKNKPLNG